MCGIVGYSGSSDAVAPIIEGLSRLEYRGYDSAGICIRTEQGLQNYKKEGKLANLQAAIKDLNLKSTTGIGHTRWATHGGVTDYNAHPHQGEEFAIVHNGIIENATDLKKDLEFEFKSETDSEVFLALVTKIYQQDSGQDELKIERAIVNAFQKVEGNSAFVIMHKATKKLFAIKNTAPLVCGVNENSKELFVSSDPYALVGYTTKLYFPEDNVLCVGDSNTLASFHFYDLDLKPSKNYQTQEDERSADIIDKGSYEHFMLKEIFEQPALVERSYKLYQGGLNSRAFQVISESQPNIVNIIGCGTALHAGMLIKNFLEAENQIRCMTDFASEFRYKKPILDKKDIGLFITQSGETADTLACQQHCQANGLKTFGLVNVEGSTIYRNCDENILLEAGTEVGVASTKAFTQMVVKGYMLSQAFKGELSLDHTQAEIKNCAQAIKGVLSKEDEIKAIAKAIYNYKGFIFTGRGNQFPIALEGALKLKEIAYVHAEGYASGELKHGPIALFDQDMVNIALVTSDLYKKTLSNAQEVKARNGVMVIVGEKGMQELQDLSDYYFEVDYQGVDILKPVVSNVVLQLLSYHIAKLKGTDIDKPRNLAKSVTVE